jgi:hypothetical protein
MFWAKILSTIETAFPKNLNFFLKINFFMYLDRFDVLI